MKRDVGKKLKKGMIVRIRSIRDKSYQHEIIVEPEEMPIPEGCQSEDLEEISA